MTAFSADLHPDMKSRPLYRPLSPDPAARAHLIVTDGCAVPDDARAAFAAIACETWIGASPDEIACRLTKERTGLRLYAIGTEAFLWDVVAVGRTAGLGLDEIALRPHGAARRRVQCVHCKTSFDVGARTTIDCAGCGLPLLVRDHFSRRLGAFMGVARHGSTRGEKPH